MLCLLDQLSAVFDLECCNKDSISYITVIINITICFITNLMHCHGCKWFTNCVFLFSNLAVVYINNCSFAIVV